MLLGVAPSVQESTMMNILVVTPDETVARTITSMLTPHGETLQLHVVANRQGAMLALEQSWFQLVVTSLKIPGVSDGYRLVSYLLKNGFDGKNVIVLVDEKSEKAHSGIAAYGIEYIHSVAECDSVITIILKSVGVATAPFPSSAASPQVISSVATEQIRSALSVVMGPVGSYIFQKALTQWKSHDKIQEFLDIIADEIGEKEQVGQFYRVLEKDDL